MALALVILAALFLQTGCASGRQAKARARAAATAAAAVNTPIQVGIIALVDEAGKFALIDSGNSPAPPAGGLLKSFTGGVESGELVTSQVRRPPFSIANINSGQPRKGDRVQFQPVMPIKRATLAAPVASIPPSS